MTLRIPTVSLGYSLAAYLGLAAPVQAQQSVYIGQVDPTAAASPRRATNASAIESALIATAPATLGLSGAAPATGNNLSEVVTSAGRSGAMTPGQSGNIAVIDQVGSANRSGITQTGVGNTARATVSGVGNVTSQTQEGTYSQSTLGILGDANTLTNSQIGNGNTSSINVVGSGYTITNTQNGSNLSYGLSVTSTNAGDKNITIDQRSIGSSLPTNPNGLPASIGSVISTRPTR